MSAQPADPVATGLVAARQRVAYHGSDTEKYLGEVGGLEAPLLMHLGEEDEFISKAAQAEIKAALAGKPNATVYSYPGQRHAFSRHNGAHCNARGGNARQQADERISASTTAVSFDRVGRIVMVSAIAMQVKALDQGDELSRRASSAGSSNGAGRPHETDSRYVRQAPPISYQPQPFSVACQFRPTMMWS